MARRSLEEVQDTTGRFAPQIQKRRIQQLSDITNTQARERKVAKIVATNLNNHPTRKGKIKVPITQQDVQREQNKVRSLSDSDLNYQYNKATGKVKDTTPQFRQDNRTEQQRKAAARAFEQADALNEQKKSIDNGAEFIQRVAPYAPVVGPLMLAGLSQNYRDIGERERSREIGDQALLQGGLDLATIATGGAANALKGAALSAAGGVAGRMIDGDRGELIGGLIGGFSPNAINSGRRVYDNTRQFVRQTKRKLDRLNPNSERFFDLELLRLRDKANSLTNIPSIRSRRTPISEEQAREVVSANLLANSIKRNRELFNSINEPHFDKYVYDAISDRYVHPASLNNIPLENRKRLQAAIAKTPSLTKEEHNIMQTFPEYYVFARKNNLPIDNEDTFAKFLDRMSTSTRGVTLEDKKLAEEYLTTAYNNKTKPGGDILNTDGGLYTANSNEISDRFSNNIADVTTNEYGATAKLYHNFNIDPNLSISKKLQQLRDKIYDTTVIEPDIRTYPYHYKNAKGEDAVVYIYNNKFIPYKDFGFEAVESPYFNETSKQRVYVTNKNKEQVATIKDNSLKFKDKPKDRHQRWSPGIVDDNEGLFLSTYANNNKANLDRYTQLYRLNTGTLHPDDIEHIGKKHVKLEELYEKGVKHGKIADGVRYGLLGAGAVGGSAALATILEYILSNAK